MQKIKYLTFGLLAMFMAALMVQPTPTQAKPNSPQVIAVGFHADWCGKCKQMAPSAAKTMESYYGELQRRQNR